MDKKESFFEARTKNKSDDDLVFAGWTVGVCGTAIVIAVIALAVIRYGWMWLWLSLGILGFGAFFAIFSWGLWFLLHKAKDKDEVNFNKSTHREYV